MGDGFAWTIPLIQAGFGVLFLALRRSGAAREARDWGVGYLLSGGAFAVSLLSDTLLPGRTVAVATDLLFAAAFFRFGAALATRYAARDLPRVRKALFALAALAPVAGVLAPSVGLELLGSDLGCALQIVVPLVLARRPRRWIDRGLVALSWLVVLANLARAVTTPFTAPDATFATFVDTTYSYLMYADGMVTGIAFGVLALIALNAETVAGYAREARRDPLTGLLNRRGLDAVAAAGADGAIVCCDLDHFKRVNDAFGHAVGDRVLAAFADLVRAALPAGGVAARVGGEEFLLYLPGRSLAEAQTVTMRLRGAMTRFDWSALGVGWRISASFGLAECRHGADALGDAVRTADDRLYEAKRRGRDRVQGLAAA